MTRAGVQSFRLTAVRALVLSRLSSPLFRFRTTFSPHINERFFKENDILKMSLLDIHSLLKNIRKHVIVSRTLKDTLIRKLYIYIFFSKMEH